MKNILAKYKPNEELKMYSKWDHILRKKGLNSPQILAVKSMVMGIVKDSEDVYCYTIIMVIISLFMNVLDGNKYMSKKKIKLAVNEVCTLWSEINLDLLDWDDIENYNTNNLQATIEFDNEEYIRETCKGSFKVSGMKSTMERAREVMDQENAELESLLEAANQTGTPEVIEAAYTYFKEFNRIKDALKKAGVLG